MTELLLLLGIALVAATVNGALGYGFSSITVPLALLFLTNRALNPAVVLVEVVLNLLMLMVNRRALRLVWPRVRLVTLGLVPTIGLGAWLLRLVAPEWVKLLTYAVLLPLLFLQVLGLRRAVALGGPAGVAVGGAVGLLYSLTTISGPPLALALNNEGLAQEEFRAALSIVRVVESTLTAIAYLALGLISSESLQLLWPIVPAMLLGVPLGTALIRHVEAETFRRVAMSFDLAIVAFGLSRVVTELSLVRGPPVWVALVVVLALDGTLLYRFFTQRRRRSRPPT